LIAQREFNLISVDEKHFTGTTTNALALGSIGACDDAESIADFDKTVKKKSLSLSLLASDTSKSDS